VALAGSNPQPVFAGFETLLVVGREDLVELFERDSIAALVCVFDQFVNIKPTLTIPLHADDFGLVPEHEAAELALGNERLVYVHDLGCI